MGGDGGQLGNYLRARRQLVRPAEVGLPDTGRRRVCGLRREEVAQLAGITSNYYLRLEQGRDRHPSPQVIDALAGALRLPAEATDYLHRLARPAARRPQLDETVPEGIAALVDGWSETPALVQGRLMDVLHANRLANALYPPYVLDRNLLRAAFCPDPDFEDLTGDWVRHAEDTVAELRAVVGPDVDDPALESLVDELCARSARFRELWARHDVKGRTGNVIRIDHPLVGPLELHSERMALAGNPSLTLVAYHAEPDTASAIALASLAAIVASAQARVLPAGDGCR